MPCAVCGKKPLEIQGLPASLFLRSAPVFGRPGPLVPPGAPCSTVRAVTGVGGPGQEWLAALRAAPAVVHAHDLPIQLPIPRQDSGAEVAAEDRAGQHLRAGAGVIPVIQQQAAAMVAVGTQGSDEPPGPAQLGLRHAQI